MNIIAKIRCKYKRFFMTKFENFPIRIVGKDTPPPVRSPAAGESRDEFMDWMRCHFSLDPSSFPSYNSVA
jgi:hypothetical protein